LGPGDNRPPQLMSGGQIVEFNIQDNGIGFEMKYAEQIFTIFQRLHGRGEYEGTGIGLATVRKIVERHGGVIAAHSEPGIGSLFTIHLPIAQGRTQQAS
ncbi:MAG: sensor histidine kinase, partial [Alphaproteobacteria bacterium]